MVELKFQIDDKELGNVIDSVMDDVADFILANSQENIVNKGIVDEGTLLKSGNIIRNYLNKQVVYSVPYADTIEYGRTPGSMPPVQPIKGWIRRKLGVNDEKQINSIAWAIAMDIKKNGLQPRPYLQPAIDSARSRFKFKR